MFRENSSHLQGNLFSTINELPEAARKVLEGSWAGVFYQEVFCRLDEQAFAGLYSEKGSRPNVPVNVLVSLEILKHGFGWTDEEMYHNYLLDLVVRKAVGYENLSDGYFAIRTVYNFRDALGTHMEKTGENILDRAFEEVTDEQIEAFGLKTGKQRMDSTQIMSDIRRYSRLTLLVEVMERVNRMLSEADQQRYGLLLAPYVKEPSEKYGYRLKKQEYSTHLEAVGKAMHQLVTGLEANYSDHETYAILVRAFRDHFRVENDEAHLLPATEVKADSLQSPDDPEATYRNKRGEAYRGYVANAAETCDPENDFQLITKVQTESNVTDDADMLVDAIPNLAERTDLETFITDGGYNGPDVDPLLEQFDIEHIQTAIRGGKPDPTQVTLVDFSFEFNQDGVPVQVTCPQGQSMPIELGRTDGRFIGRPDPERCATFPFFANCQVRPQGNQQSPALYLDKRQVLLASKRQTLDALPQDERNLRPPVESTMRSLKHPFRHGKILLRGKFRIACAIIGSAFMTNLRRIHRAQQRNTTSSPTPTPDAHTLGQPARSMPFFSRFPPLNLLLTSTPSFGFTFPTFIQNRRLCGFLSTHPTQPQTVTFS